MHKKGEFVKFKNYDRKVKSLFLIYPDFEGILLSENNAKQISEGSYANKYQKKKLFTFMDINQYVKALKTYLGEYAFCKFINSMIEESKCFSKVMKKHFKIFLTKNKNLQ